jgi:6-phosphogluconolactonase
MVVQQQLQLYQDVAALNRAAAESVIDAAHAAIEARGRFLWCLSGGRTPKAVFELLAKPELARELDWSRTQVFFGDERCVPPNHPDSNYRMAADALLRHVPLAATNVHRIVGEQGPADAARNYEKLLKEVLGVTVAGRPASTFDQVLLGLGDDAHTASLFPSSVDDPSDWVAARLFTDGKTWRVTLTPICLNAAATAVFWVTGSNKAAPLARVLSARRDPRAVPAQRIQPSGRLVFMVDAAAASALPESLLASANRA